MKLFILINIFAVSLVSFSAHAFISSSEQAQLLTVMNTSNTQQIRFEDIRCSARSRMCLVRMELGAKRTPVGCSIERLNGAGDLYTETSAGLQLSPYAENALRECVAGFAK